MNEILPFFPLNIVVFPGEILNLHIYEPRYKQLILECQKTGMRFGIPTFFEKKSLDYGTEMELMEISHTYPDGRMDIKSKGLRVFHILKFNKSLKDKLYPGGTVEYSEDDPTGDILRNKKILEKLKELFQIMNIKKNVPPLDQNFNSFKIAHLVGFSLNQEYQLILMPSEVERLDFIHDHLTNLIPVVIEMENLRKKAEMNGHFKNLKAPDF